MSAVHAGEYSRGTVCRRFGQLAGAIYGARVIPEKWREALAWGDEIEAWADELALAPEWRGRAFAGAA